MIKLTFQFIIFELLEKIYRLESFILKNTVEQGNNSNSAIILIFEKTKSYILFNINAIIEEVNSLDESFTPTEIFAIQRSLSNCFVSITLLHKELNFLHTNWLKLETYTFIEQVMDYNLKSKNTPINIILSDEYTFLETNLSTKLDSITEMFYDNNELKTNSISPTVILPKIEFSNPLNWSILVHELCHIDSEKISILTSSDSLYPINASEGDKEKLKNWAEEIYCDIYASSIIGPAYFLSLSSFALLQCLVTGYGKSSKTHPAYAMRLALLNRYLDKYQLDIPFDLNNVKHDSIHLFIYNMFLTINKNIKNVGFNIKEVEIPDLMVFDQHLRENIDIPCIINKEELICLDFLVTRLKDRIPIGSYRINELDIENITKLKSDIEKDEFEKIKNSLTERKTKLWEILNSGWIYKLNILIPFAQNLFFEQEKHTIETKLRLYGEQLELLDDRLLASIEISKLIELIEN